MKNRKIFWGIFFILAAVFVLVSKIGIFPDISVIGIFLTVFLVWVFVEGIRNINFYEMLFSLAFLCIIYDKPLGITALTPWPVLAAALFGSIGLSMIFRGKKRQDYTQFEWNESGHIGGVGSSAEQCSGEQIRCENNFGTAIRYINSDNFRHAQIENNFGTMSVYFDNAVVQAGSASVSVENNFGSVQLYLPKEWKVVNNLEHSLGAIKEKGTCLGTSGTVMYLTGSANFGEINVIYI